MTYLAKLITAVKQTLTITPTVLMPSLVVDVEN